MLADVADVAGVQQFATICFSLATPGAPSRHADHNVDPLPRRPMTPGPPPQQRFFDYPAPGHPIIKSPKINPCAALLSRPCLGCDITDNILLPPTQYIFLDDCNNLSVDILKSRRHAS